MKERIIELLMAMERPGMDKLVAHMEEMGFFEAPCSTRFHLAKKGGLAEHSYNVFTIASDLGDILMGEAGKMPKELADSVTICALLHDIGKAGQYGKPAYVPNMLKGRESKPNPDPAPYQSTKKPFETNTDLLPVEHEVRALQILSQYIPLTEEESFAILMHNGMYGPFKYQLQGKETPLYLILHMADMWASRVTEKEGGAV